MMRALGLMSGTSLDGIDAAILETDGEVVTALGPALSVPYDPALRERLRSVLGGAGDVEGVARDLTLAHAAAVTALAEEASASLSEIDVIGFHGHTILHRPHERLTWQIGDGALLARLTGRPVVDQFRLDDVAAGGQGAPLVPIYHRALLDRLSGSTGEALAVLNIGGVANLTYVPAERTGELLAFDTGPGGAMIDDWMRMRTGTPLDRGGALASRGRVADALLVRLLAHPYFSVRPPKSLDRDEFARSAFTALADLPTADGVATLTAFTARAVERACDYLPQRPGRWLVTGGNRHNATLMARLGERLGQVEPIEAIGGRGDSLEAEAFGFLAVRSVRGLPLTLPGTTGVDRPLGGGRLHRPETVTA